MQQFNDLLKDILKNGRESSNRTAKRSKKVFGRQLRWNLAEGFPLVTCRKIFTRGVFLELEWFLKGLTSNEWLKERGVGIWNEWALTDEHLNSFSPLQIDGAERYDRYMEKVKTEQGEEAKQREVERFNGLIGKPHLSHEEGHRIFDEAGIPKFKTYRELGFKVGDLGPIYGKQWTAFNWKHGDGINQIKEVEQILLTKPMSRRMIVSAWSPEDLPDESKSPQQNVLDGKMALAACHTMFQLFVDEATLDERVRWASDNYPEIIPEIKRIQQNRGNFVGTQDDYESYMGRYLDTQVIPKLRLSLQLYQRSLDTPIGGPFNIASYATLTHIFANVADMIPGEFIWTTGDTHVYLDQLDCINEQLSRDPKPLPRLKIKRKLQSVFDFTAGDLEIIGYDPHPKINYPDPAV